MHYIKKKKTYLRQTFFFVYGLDPAISSQFMTPSVATLSCKVEGQNRSELTCAHHCPFQDLASGWGLPVCVLVLYLTHPLSYPVSVSPLYFWRLKFLGFSKFSFWTVPSQVRSQSGGGTSGKEPACQCRRYKRCKFDPWVRKIPLEMEMATHSSILSWKIPWMEELLVGYRP